MALRPALLALLLVGCESECTGTVSPQHVRCYSAGTTIYDGDSEGVVMISHNSWSFRDARTHLITEVRGDCVTSPVRGTP